MNRKPIKLTDAELRRIVKESVNKFVNESEGYVEDIPCIDVLNDNFDGNWKSVLTANVYDKDDNLLGSLREMHFKYAPESNKMIGSW